MSYNLGTIGIGKYNSVNNPDIYQIWNAIFQRCFNKKHLLRKPSYIGCSVDFNWYNFQNFAKWYEENYIKGFALDKDILVKGNKVYGPDTCCFVPLEINNLFCKSNAIRDLYPIGVSFDKLNQKYKARLKINGKEKFLGRYNTIQEAFQTYKIAKEIYIKEIADKWKDKITDKVYQALYNYQVEITD